MKTKLIAHIFIGLGSLFLMSGSCDKKEITCEGSHPELTYEKHIKPIVDKNCTECHEVFTSYAGLEGVVKNGEFEHEVIEEREMPPSGKLSTEELIVIKCWLENGAKEN